MWTALYTIQPLCWGPCVTDLHGNPMAHTWLNYLRFPLWKTDSPCGVEVTEPVRDGV